MCCCCPCERRYPFDMLLLWTGRTSRGTDTMSWTDNYIHWVSPYMTLHTGVRCALLPPLSQVQGCMQYVGFLLYHTWILLSAPSQPETPQHMLLRATGHNGEGPMSPTHTILAHAQGSRQFSSPDSMHQPCDSTMVSLID